MLSHSCGICCLFKQKTAYEMRISDWSSDVCSSDLLARTDPDAPKHRGITAFMVPLDAHVLEVRPLRQMSGGSSFNEVFLTEERIPAAYRIGEVGDVWTVALTTPGFESPPNG